jgi:hypothetical protein
MSNVEEYNMKLEVIKAIPDDQIKNPKNIPPGIYIQEAEDLYKWCQDDKEELTSKGLDWKVVEDLPVRCDALSVAASNWNVKQSQRRASAKIWLKEASKGYDLRNELVHHFRYAFRDDSSLILRVTEISKRITRKGMIKGLRDLFVLGKANRDLLTKIGFDLTLLDMARIKADELDAKYEAGSWDREDYREVKKIRDQAFTHLKEAVDYIREYARYVFWRNAYRLKGYRSNYLRRIRLRNTRKKTEPEPGTGFEMVQIDS